MIGFRIQRSMVCIAALSCLLQAAPAGATPFSVLTYNVAGLPGALKVARNELISPKFDASVFDVIAIQEAFDPTIYASHANDNTGFPSANTPGQEAAHDGTVFPSGLMRLSNSAHTGYLRQDWNLCENADQLDCFANKGFSFARHDLGGGAEVDIYNWHAEAGNTANDVIARNSQITQFLDYIDGNSGDRAVILLGDTNSRYTRTTDDIRDILNIGFNDAWLDKYYAGVAPPQTGDSNTADCDTNPDSANCELKDKIFFRSGATVQLTLNGYSIPSNFIDGDGDPLSDHEPVSASFDVAVIPEPTTALQVLAGLAILGARSRRRRT
jgi:endonuclease/exonuclease/phosphatase family metal-dependent hydrolase